MHEEVIERVTHIAQSDQRQVLRITPECYFFHSAQV